MPLKRPHVFSSPGTTCPESSLTNPVGFDEVYRIYVDRVYAYLLARVSDRHTAADLTQHVFCRPSRRCPAIRIAG